LTDIKNIIRSGWSIFNFILLPRTLINLTAHIDDVVHAQEYLIQICFHVAGNILKEIENVIRGVKFFFESSRQRSCGYDGLLGEYKLVLGVGEGGDGLRLPPHVVAAVHPATEVLYEAVSCGGCQFPLQDTEEVQLPLLELCQAHGVVCVVNQLLRADGDDLAELGGKENADRGYKLELRLLDVDEGEEPVQVADSEEEDFGLAVLVLADLKHPVSDDLPHVRLDGCLSAVAVVHNLDRVLGEEEVLQHPDVSAQHPVTVGLHTHPGLATPPSGWRDWGAEVLGTEQVFDVSHEKC